MKPEVNFNLPFAFYRLPNESAIGFMSQQSASINPLVAGSLNQTGFAFVPWSESNNTPAVLIKADIEHNLSLQDFLKFEINPIGLEAKADKAIFETDQGLYNTQIDAIQAAIKAGNIEKAILSRIQVEALPAIGLQQCFANLCAAYPQVMCYWVHVPDLGSWMGATPEVLVDVTTNELKTVSLAGTQADTGKDVTMASWGDKEINEQQIVTDSITAILKEHFTGQIAINGPYTFSTGSLLHLKTDFTVQLTKNDWANIAAVVKALHPTPAISGFPKQAAIDLINSIEQHSRAYYTGYLGPIHANKSIKLFVNLRCMQIFEQHIALYLGGGITAGSIATDEWHETVIKTHTLLKVMNE